MLKEFHLWNQFERGSALKRWAKEFMDEIRHVRSVDHDWKKNKIDSKYCQLDISNYYLVEAYAPSLLKKNKPGTGTKSTTILLDIGLVFNVK
jgi:hypothetical protein